MTACFRHPPAALLVIAIREISRGQNPNDCRQLAEPVHLRMRLHSSGATTGRAHLLGISSNPANAAALSHVRCSS